MFSSFYNGLTPEAPYQFGQKAYSTTFLKKAKDRIELHNSYQNEEIGNYYYRGFAGANNGLLCNYEYNEVISPFQDIDLLQASLHIPLNIRYGHELYFKWILNRYPEAAKYVWEKLGGRIDRKFGIINFHGHKIRLETVPGRVLNKLFQSKASLDNKKNMNPIGYYLQTNVELRDWMDKYIVDNIQCVPDKELYEDVLTMVKKNNTIDKIEIITLLSALKLFFN